jgi:hypothetical protein
MTQRLKDTMKKNLKSLSLCVFVSELDAFGEDHIGMRAELSQFFSRRVFSAVDPLFCTFHRFELEYY